MAELPELETVRRELEKEAVGKRFKARELTGAKVTRHHSNKKVFASRLDGHKVQSIDRKGRPLVANLATGRRLVLHPGEVGHLRSVTPRSTRHKGTAVWFALQNEGP